MADFQTNPTDFGSKSLRILNMEGIKLVFKVVNATPDTNKLPTHLPPIFCHFPVTSAQTTDGMDKAAL